MPFQLSVDEELINAIIDGRLEEVKRLLDAGAKLDGHPGLSHRPLLLAARHCSRGGGRLDVLKLIIARGADLETESPRDVYSIGHRFFANRSRALHAAVHAGRLAGRADAVRVLLEAGAESDPKDSEGATPLFYAVGAKSGPCLLELLKGGADPAVRKNGATPLHVAALIGAADLIPMLLAAVPELANVPDHMGATPLYYAATGSDPMAGNRALRYLLAAGAIDRRMAFQGGVSSLHASVERDNEVAVRMLLQHIEAARGYDTVPLALHEAAVKGNARLLRLLLLVEGDEGLERWARVAVGKAGAREPILHIAARHCSLAVVGVLLQAGADPAATNSHGQRASDVIGVAPTAEGGRSKEAASASASASAASAAAAAATSRTLERGPAFGARSFAWPLEPGAGLADGRPQVALGVRVFRPRNGKFLVKVLARHPAKR